MPPLGVAAPCSGASCTFTQSTTTNGSAETVASGQVCDAAGNCMPGITSTAFQIASVTPAVSLSFSSNGTNGWFNTPTATGTVTATDATSGVASIVCTDNGNPLTVATNGAQSVTGDGSHAVSCTATDNAGNVSTPSMATGKIDSTAPEASLQLAPPPAAAPNLTVTGRDVGNDPTVVTGPTCASQTRVGARTASRWPRRSTDRAGTRRQITARSAAPGR